MHPTRSRRSDSRGGMLQKFMMPSQEEAIFYFSLFSVSWCCLKLSSMENMSVGFILWTWLYFFWELLSYNDWRNDLCYLILSYFSFLIIFNAYAAWILVWDVFLCSSLSWSCFRKSLFESQAFAEGLCAGFTDYTYSILCYQYE
jgi:hypothetical protein